MRIPTAALLLVCLLPGAAQAQAAAAPTASSLLSPSLEQLRQSLLGLRLDKWKAPGPVRQEASGNIGSITRDLDGTLPGLLATADAAPGTVSKNLPVFRNVDALYDVLLRVVETADLAAPDNETDALHRALSSLEDARRSLGDAMETAALNNEGQLAEAKTQLRTQAPAAAAASTTVVDGGAAKPAAAAARKRKPTAARPVPAAQPAPQ